MKVKVTAELAIGSWSVVLMGKTQKGSSYAIVKFSDLSNVFELFIFSEIFETNRNILKEGNSVLLTLIKNFTDENKTQKRVNVKKIISLNELTNQQIKNITFKFSDIESMKKLKKLSNIDGETDVKLIYYKDDKIHEFKFKSKRKVNNQLINSLNLEENIFIE